MRSHLSATKYHTWKRVATGYKWNKKRLIFFFKKIPKFCIVVVNLNNWEKHRSYMVKAVWKKLYLWESVLLGSVLSVSEIPSVPPGAPSVPLCQNFAIRKMKTRLFGIFRLWHPQRDAARLGSVLWSSGMKSGFYICNTVLTQVLAISTINCSDTHWLLLY